MIIREKVNFNENTGIIIDAINTAERFEQVIDKDLKLDFVILISIMSELKKRLINLSTVYMQQNKRFRPI